MRWITFCILIYAAAALQAARFLALSVNDHPAIEYLPLIGIFYALFAPEETAPLCGFWCGLALDLISSDQPLGTHAVPLALVAYTVTKIRLSIFREHVVSQFIVALLGVLLFALLAGAFRAITDREASQLIGTFFAVSRALAINAIYSAAVAPVIFWLLLRLKPILGFEVARGRKR
jgi:rod shape-determining protein MreD